MNAHTDIAIKNYTTMKLGGNARFMAEVRTPDDVRQVYQFAKEQSLPVFILGGGSNVIARDEGFDGVIMLNRIAGFEQLGSDETGVQIKVGAGENWDEVVRRVVEMGLSGIEALSAIPGTAGAAPVQNVGAYGQEIADTFVSLEAYDTQTDQIVTLGYDDCQFSYRDSVFRGEAWGRYCIVSVTFKLYRETPQPPFYAALQSYLDEHGTTIYTPAVIREAVTAIRRDKLPDPRKLPNAGSFFKNAIIEDWLFTDLQRQYPAMPSYEMAGGEHKIPTGWLIEQTGLKGQVLHGMKIHDKNALVLINQSATGYHDLAAARDEIKAAVYDKFRIQIEQEPLELAL